MNFPFRPFLVWFAGANPEYCALPRDYLSDTPSPFFEPLPPMDSMRSGGAIPPKLKGISAIPARHHMKTSKMGAIPPLRYYLEEVLRDMWAILH